MGMSRCYLLMKGLLILLNIILLGVGSAACGVCLWALWDGRATESAEARAGLCALATWGGALAFAALAAICGAARHSSSLLAAAFALLALTAVAEAAAAWWGSAHQPQLRQALRDSLHYSMKHDYGVVYARTEAIDTIQQKLQCCGTESARDWQGSAWARSQADGDSAPAPAPATAPALDLSVTAPSTYYWVPASCCESTDPDECAVSRRVPAASGSAAGLHAAGCGARALAALAEIAKVPLAVAAGLFAAHALALLLALGLCLRARPDTRYKA